MATLAIKIGHPAYSGANAMAWASSKNEAVNILRSREVKRDVARAAITMALVGNDYSTVRANDYGCPIEITVMVGNLSHEEKVELERKIMRDNPKLALDLINEFKAHHGYAPNRSTIVRSLLLVKQQVREAPATQTKEDENV